MVFQLQAQEKFIEKVDPISTDRPDQTEGAGVLPLKYFQMETGFNIEGEDGDLKFVHPDILWRAGIFKSTELRVIMSVSSAKDTTGKYKAGLEPMEIGFKTAICEEKKARPKISFLGHMVIPYLSTKNRRTKYFAPNLRFSMEHTLKKNISLGYNVGMEWDGDSPYPSFVYTVVNGFDVKGKWHFYYEFFGEFPIKEKSTHNFDTGICYQVKNNMQIDVSGGFQLYPFVKGWYASIGYSFRIPR